MLRRLLHCATLLQIEPGTLCLLLLTACSTGAAIPNRQPSSTPVESVDMFSPDSALRVHFGLKSGKDGVPQYAIQFHGEPLILDSPLGLRLNLVDFTSGLKVVDVKSHDVDTSYALAIGKTSQVRNHYREYDIHLALSEDSRRALVIRFRLYDDGVAFRYVIPEQRDTSEFLVLTESTKIVPSGNPTTVALPLEFGSSYEGKYLTVPYSQLPGAETFGVPAVFIFPSQTYVSIAEADPSTYPQTYLATDTKDGFSLRYPDRNLDGTLAVVQGKVTASTNFHTPWRVFMVGTSAKPVLESNLIGNLNPEPTANDLSWIHPGKVLFQWWNGYVTPGHVFPKPEDALSTDTLIRHVDFCAKYGIETFSLDGYEMDKAWYGGKVAPYEGQDVTRSAIDIDLPRVLQHAHDKGVKTRIWLHEGGLTLKTMAETLATYSRWGAAGVMVDFMNDDTQRGAEFTEQILKTAAKHHLTVGIHGNPKPRGLARTYPNYLTQEGVFGQEYNKWPGNNSTPDHEVNIAFVRGTVGPMDTHEGVFRPVPQADFVAHAIAPVSIGTLARQLAMYVVYENEQPMLVDYPEAYEKHLAAFDFIRQVPVTWDETRMLAGDFQQKFLTIARRRGSDWYLGSMTGEGRHEHTVALDFLGFGNYCMETYADTATSEKDGESIAIKQEVVTAKSHLTISMAKAGGHAARFKKVPAAGGSKYCPGDGKYHVGQCSYSPGSGTYYGSGDD